MRAEQAAVQVVAFDNGGVCRRGDRVASEAPLQIRVAGAAPTITMRTPGHDRELAAGLLLSEGLIRDPQDLAQLACAADGDAVDAVLRDAAAPAAAVLARGTLMSSACGVCGKQELGGAALARAGPQPAGAPLPAAVLLDLPRRLRRAQGVFSSTGGLHAAGLFAADGDLLAVREDVGRHNAVDKLFGWALLDGRLPLHGHGLLLSGRASYELVHKAIAAGVGMVCAVSAPSSLAVTLARDYGLTLVGFLREGRFNVYAHPARVLEAARCGDLAAPQPAPA